MEELRFAAGCSEGKEFARKEILLEPGVIGAANQLVIYDEVYKDLFASLLGQILVVKDMDAGIKIANKYHHSVRIVTLDGDSLNRGGAMSGGAFKNKSNLLGRSREVEELKKKLDRWTKAITEDEENIMKMKKTQRISAKYDRLRERDARNLFGIKYTADVTICDQAKKRRA